MRVGIDASNIREGGGVTHLTELLKAAQLQADEISRIVVWAGKNTIQKIETKPWLEVIHEPLLDGSLLQRLYWQINRLPQLARQNVDILFVPGGFYLGSFRPIVTISQNLLPFQYSEMSRYGLSWTFIRLLTLRFAQTQTFRHAEGMIFLTQYAQCTVLKQAKILQGCSAIIPHGIDKRFALSPRVQRPIEDYSFDQPFRLLYVSIINFYKHQWHVATAIAQLRKEGIPVSLDLVGPAYPPALRRLQKVMTSIDPNHEFIHYHGSVPFEKLDTYYHQADGFIFASSCENMPNIMLEAMASGLPVACSQRGPMPEVLGDAGLYFDPEEPTDIAATLQTMLQNSEVRERCAWMAFQYAQEYNWERCANETLTFIANIAKKHKIA